jgi:acylphosphatase
MSTVARRVRVHGHVQGVFFRDSCTREAESRGVSGWVRNDEDGTVSAHFEGEDAPVAAMVAWCRTGPPRAAVSHVDAEDVDPEHHTRFEVR